MTVTKPARVYTKRRLTVAALVQKVQEILDIFSISRDMERAEQMIQDLAALTQRQKPGPKLSTTTLEVDRLLLEGETPREICEHLKVSQSTVKRRQAMSRQPKEKACGTKHVHGEITEKSRQEGGDLA